MRKFIALGLCAALIAGIFCGCAREDTPYVPTGNALVMDDGPAVTAPTLEPQKEQEMTLVYYPDRSLNPYTCTDYTNRVIFSLIYQGLFSVDRNYNAVPMLCKNYSVSYDLTTFTFYPDPDATFSDGTHVTVKDVLMSLLAAWDSPYYEGRFLHVYDIYATTDGGVRVQLYNACENFPLLMDIPILKASEVNASMPLGTGPYSLSVSVRGARLNRVKNWWCSSDDLLATASSIALRPASGEIQIRDSFEFEDVGLVCADPCSDSYADYRCDYELWNCENGIFLYLTVNEESKIYSNYRLMSALTYGIDRDTLVNTLYRGFAESACLPASPWSPFYSKSLASNYAYDLNRFIQSVSESGMRGQRVKLLVNGEDSLRLRAARSIAQMLNAGGLNVELSILSGHDYQYALNMRDFDMYLGQTKLSATMDLTAFFRDYGGLSFGGTEDETTYAMNLEALSNSGNFYNLHKLIMDKGQIVPILFCSYAVYAERGLLTELNPARDNVFFYTLGKTLTGIQIHETDSWEDPEVTAVPTVPGTEPENDW